MSKINLSILGYGFMGQVYTYAANVLNNFYPDSPEVKIKSVLISKEDKTKIERLKKRYGFEEVTSNINQIIENKDIDAVYIATPNNFHHEQVLSSLKQNKNVLCEKPFTLSVQEAEEIIKCKEERKTLIGNVVFEYRFLPAITKIRSIIKSGDIGEITQFRIMYLHGSYAEDREVTWRLKKGTGGSIVDLGPHVIDLIHHLLGPIDILSANLATKIIGREVDDFAQVICKTKNGADGYLEVSRLATGSVDDLRIEIHGIKGSVSWSLENLNFFKFFKKDSANVGYKTIPCFSDETDNSDFPPPKVSLGWLMPHVHCLYSFVKQIEDKSYKDSRSAKFVDGLSVQRVLEEIQSKQ